MSKREGFDNSLSQQNDHVDALLNKTYSNIFRQALLSVALQESSNHCTSCNLLRPIKYRFLLCSRNLISEEPSQYNHQ